MAWGQGGAWSGGSTAQWRRLRTIVLNRDEHRCQLGLACCTGEATEVDHIINRAAGGSDDLENLRAVCQSCHRVLTQRQANAARPQRKRPPEEHPGRRKRP
ncbi:HNH endonuclease [Rhodococcus opacus]|uniref:HNH endonuclease n=1 Tax=Rhodococcus opacus TaxID=37919 RepID=A0A2S8JAS6_RHOOP|nr:HNH endonuclease signature motif containing protein [Rhodococcus opacus]PQP24151.1 HNH endonuclease [Rhodococcus opacus]